MGATMQLDRPSGNYQRNDPVVRELALELGMEQSSAHQLLYGPAGIRARMLVAIRVFRFVGAHERLGRWAAPIRAALDLADCPSLTKTLIAEVQRLDLAEDMAENEYRADESDANARRWVAAIDRLIEFFLRLRAAIVAKHQLGGE